jgi:hypothetical protein
MQEAGESSGMARRRLSTTPSPVAVFVGLMVVLIAVGAAVLLTRESTPPPPKPAPVQEPNFALTDAEAIARFNELRDLRDQLYGERDLSLVSEIYAADSPLRATVASEINQLLSDHVLDRSTYRSLDVSVVSNTPQQIVMAETVLLSPKFVTESGRDVTTDHSQLRQRAVWTLVQLDGQWLVRSSKITKSKAIRD